MTLPSRPPSPTTWTPLTRGPVRGVFDPVRVAVARHPADLDAIGLPMVPDEATTPSVTRLYVNASQRCNLRCTYCFADFGERYDGGRDMDPAIARRAVDLALERLDPARRNFRLVFFGGEPWLAFDLCLELLEHTFEVAARQRDPVEISALFVTNFTLPTAEQIRRVAGLPVDISVSVDGGRREHDRHRVHANGRGSWEQVADRVRRFAPIVPGALSAITTVTPFNLDLVETVNDVMELGFHQMCVRHVFCPDPRINLDRPAVRRLIEAYDRSARVNLDRVRRGEPAEFELFRVHFEILRSRVLARYPCGAGREWFTLTTAGRLFPCPEFSPDLPVGGVDEGFDEAAVASFSASTGVRAERPCEGCVARPFCRGGCSAEAFHLTGRHDAHVDARCELAQGISHVAAGLYLALGEEAPDVLDRFVGYRRSGLSTEAWRAARRGGASC